MKKFALAPIPMKFGYKVVKPESVVKISSSGPLPSGLDKSKKYIIDKASDWADSLQYCVRAKKSKEDEDKLNYDFVKELERL